jgi:predicted esterase
MYSETVIRWLSSFSRASSFLSSSQTCQVGVADFRTSNSSIPCRFFYPCEITHSLADGAKNSQNRVSWFVNGFSYFVEGYLHVLLPKWRESVVMNKLIALIAVIASLFFPMAHVPLPNCYYNGHAKQRSQHKYPLILFSHGLTGTNEEHALMFSYWVQQGYVVAAIHHCDGSSNQVPLTSQTHLLYVHPDMENYDINFRPNQIEQRESEFNELREFILQDGSFPKSIRSIIDESQIIAAGFSYGAATASLSVSRRAWAFKACMLLDGWFFIDIPGKAAFHFPNETHENGINVPCLFVGSADFAEKDKLSAATTQLHYSCPTGSEYHVIEGTKHQNFTDVGFWLPIFALKSVGMIGRDCNYYESYREILRLTSNFLEVHTHKMESPH